MNRDGEHALLARSFIKWREGKAFPLAFMTVDKLSLRMRFRKPTC